MELAAELEAALRELVDAADMHVRENGGRAAPVTSLSWKVRGVAHKPLLHLWANSYNLTRRVLAITERSETSLTLAVERFGRTKPDRLVLTRADYERSARQLSREDYCRRFGVLLAEKFPDETVESISIAADLEHSLSGNYARAVTRRGSVRWAILGVRPGESSDTVDTSITVGLLWLERTCQQSRGTSVAGLRLILPEGTVGAVGHRLKAVRARIPIELYSRNEGMETLERIDPQSCGNIGTWLVPCRESQALLDQAREAIDPLVQRAPKAITVHAVVPSGQVWLRFRGLTFAVWEEGRVWYGTSEPRQELTAGRRSDFEQLMNRLEIERAPLSDAIRSALYRGQPERWLEAVVREDITRVDAALDSRFVYSQVFANSGGEHGILDVLTVTRSGRLAIIELKASEHIDTVMQAADYWLRIRRHLQQGDLPRNGYFPGVTLQTVAPLVYLVAPAMRFHPTTDTLLRWLDPEMEVIRVGLAESWRRGLRVVMRQ